MIRRKLLLLDDESLLLHLYSMTFSKRGFDCVVSNNAFKALELLKNNYVPDAILFDINMPAESGFEFLQEIQKLPWLNKTLKIALTNEGQDGVLERLRELHVDDILIKAHYLPKEIIKKVEQMLAERSA